MARLLLVVAVVAVVYLLIRSFRKNPSSEFQDTITEDMVRCAHCGVHLPKSEGVLSAGKFFCSKEHRDAHLK